MAADDISPDSAPPVAGNGGGLGEWVKQHKGIAVAGLVLLVGGGYLIYRKRKSASSSSSSTTSTTGGSLGTSTGGGVYEVAPGSLDNGSGSYYGDGTSGSLYSGLQQLETQISSIAAAQNSANASAGSSPSGVSSTSGTAHSAATATVAPTSAGYGTVTVDGESYDLLGTYGSKQPTYQVGGGAPVSFYTGSGAPAQGVSAEKVGAEELVPTSYSALVSTKPL